MIIAEYNEKPVPLPISDEELIQLAQEEDSHSFSLPSIPNCCMRYQRVRPEKEASRIHDAAGNEPAGPIFSNSLTSGRWRNFRKHTPPSSQ